MKITWLGHSTFALEFPGGQVLVLDPWLKNPRAPKDYKLKRVDAIALSHGHNDHTGDVVSLAAEFRCPVVALFELAGIFEKKGVQNTVGIGKGGTYDLGFARITASHAFHSSSFDDGDETIYAGEPASLIVEAEGEPTLYFAGDTCVFGDMALIAELYKPVVAMLPVGGHFTMGPKEAAVAARLLQVKQVIPMHYGTFPPLKGTPEQLSELVSKDGIQIATMTPGEEQQW